MKSNFHYFNMGIINPEKVHPNFTNHFKNDLYYNQCSPLCNPVAFCVLFELENALKSRRNINSDFSIPDFIDKCLGQFFTGRDFSKEDIVNKIDDPVIVDRYYRHTNKCKNNAMLALAFGSIAITGKINDVIHKNTIQLLKKLVRQRSSFSIKGTMLNDLENFPYVTEDFFEL